MKVSQEMLDYLEGLFKETPLMSMTEAVNLLRRKFGVSEEMATRIIITWLDDGWESA